jgi:hypothetical protein
MVVSKISNKKGLNNLLNYLKFAGAGYGRNKCRISQAFVGGEV